MWPASIIRGIVCSAFLLLFFGSPFAVASNVSTSLGDGPSPWGKGFGPDVIDDTDIISPRDFDDDLLLDLPEPPNVNVTGLELNRRAVGDFWLRIMPLGASITQGVGSDDGNGYRKLLRDQLRYAGWDVNMVGSKLDGTMRDRVSWNAH